MNDRNVTVPLKLFSDSGDLIATLTSPTDLKQALTNTAHSKLVIQVQNSNLIDRQEFELTECFIGSFESQSQGKWLLQRKTSDSIKTLIAPGRDSDANYVEGVCFGHLTGIHSKCILEIDEAVMLICDLTKFEGEATVHCWVDDIRPLISHGELLTRRKT